MRMMRCVLVAAMVLLIGCGDDDDSQGAAGAGGSGGGAAGDGGASGGGGSGSGDESLAAIQVDIFDKACAFSSCHSSEGHKGNMILGKSDAVPSTEVYKALVGVAATIDPALVRVTAGDPSKSLIIAKLKANTAMGFKPTTCDESVNACGDPMPQNAPYLGDDKIARIERWIMQGAKDN